MATKPKVGQIKSSQPRFELLDASPDQFEAIRFYDDAPAAPAPEEEGRTIGGTIKDVGISALKGAIAVPEAAVGLADLVTGGYAGKLLENEGGAVGFRPKQAKAALEEGYSPAQKAAFQRVQAAEGLGDTFMAAVQNPSVIGQSVVESLPLMGAGGVLARGGLALAPRLAAAPGAGIVAGAVGEGAVGAGSAAESIRQQSADGLLTGGQAGLAAASGGATALFGYLGGKVAQKLGIADVDTMLAGAATDPALRKGVVRSALEGAFAEGVLEELPQSISEQVLQNIALDRPLDEGVNQAAVLGLLSGGLMGGGANVVNSITAPAASGLPEPAVKPTAAPAPAGPLTRAANRAAMANLQTVQSEELGMPDVPQTAAPDGRAILLQREEQARLKREAEQAAQRAVEGPDDEILQSTGAQPIMAAAGLPQTASEAEEDAAAQKVIDARRATELAKAPAAAADPEPAGRFTSAKEAQDYISAQRRASSATLPRALPIQNEDGSFGVAVDGTQAFTLAMEQDRVRRLQAAGVLPDDVLNPKGEPFKTKASATTAAKKLGGQVVPVTGGFVVRKQQAVTDGAGAGVAPDAAASDGAGRPDAAPGVGSGVPDGDRLGANTRRAKAGGVGQSFELPFGAADDAVTQKDEQPGAGALVPSGGMTVEVAGQLYPVESLKQASEMRFAARKEAERQGRVGPIPDMPVRDGSGQIIGYVGQGDSVFEKAGDAQISSKKLYDAPADAAKATKAPNSKDSTGKQASWVIREKSSGNVVMETFDRKKVEALNTEKFDAVPIAEHLASLNQKKPASNEQAPAKTPATSLAKEGLPGAGAAGQPVEAAGVEGTPKKKTKGSEAVSPALREAMERMGLDPDAPADKARELRKKADALQNEARKMVEGIPPGQPVMTVTDQNRRERAAEKSRKAADLFAQADKLDAEKAANPAGTQPAAEPPKSVDSTAPEHQAVGVDDRELGEIVEEFNDAQRRMVEDDEKVTHVFDPPAQDEIVRLGDKAKVYHKDHGWMTPAEAKAKIAEWKKHAADQFENDDIRRANSQKIVISLFDLTGSWSAPWEEAGYQVFRFDIQDDSTYTDPETGEEKKVGDVNNMSVEFFNDLFGSFDGNDVHAVLAACPCTDFAVSGARHFAAKDADGRTVASVKLVHQTLNVIEYFKPAVWAIENPVGRIERLGGLPPWRLSFDPNHLGDPYTKKTLLWGRFNADLPVAPVEPTEGSKMHQKYGGKSLKTKNARSATPEGFAYGFFMANNAHDHPAMAISNKYDRLDRDLIEKAIKAGVTEDQINSAVEDLYYQSLDDEGANAAIQRLTDDATLPSSKKGPEQAAEPFTHSGLKVYPTRVKQQDGSIKQQWAVQTAENAAREQRGERQIGGDELVDTREQAIQRAEEMAARAEREANDKADLETKERQQAEKEAASKAEAEDIDGFMTNATKLVRGRIVKTLSTPIMQGGKQTTRKALVRERVAAGAKVEQAKEGRRLVMPSGAYLGEDQISKTAMDYAEHLIAQRGAEPAEQSPADKWASMSREQRGKMLDAAFGAGQTDAAERYAGREWDKFNVGQQASLAAMMNAPATQATHQDPGEKSKPAAKAANGDDALRQQLEDHFAPGNVILSDYWKKHDRVVSFDWNGGNWSVKVQSVEKKGDKWEPAGEIRTHSTRPDKRDKVVQRGEKAPADAGQDAAGYSLPQGSVWDDWRGSEAPGFKPTARQQAIMDAVGKAIEEGKFYNDAVRKRTAQILGLQDVDTGEGGTFSTDAYMARKTLEAQKMAAAVKDAFDALNLKEGDKIGVIVTSDGKMSNAVTVTKAGENGYGMVLEGRRGAAGVRFPSLDALQLKNAIDRAKEKGRRKDGFDDFVKARQGGEVPAAGTNDRDSFTLERLNAESGQMEPVTFERGEYVSVKLTGGKDASGEIDGISHARREFSVDGLWHPFGFAYKAERPAKPKPDTVPLSSVIEKMNAKNGEGLTDADRVPGSADIGWDTMSPEQRTQILTAPGGWSTAKGGLNAVGKGLAKRAWADIVPATRATIEGLVKKVSDGVAKSEDKRNIWIPNMTVRKLEKLLAKDQRTADDIEDLKDFRYFLLNDLQSAEEKGFYVRYASDNGGVPVLKNKFWLTNIEAAISGGQAQPTSKTPTVDAHEKVMAAVREGTATPEQFKASFEAVVSSKEAIVAELSTKTKAELLRDGGYFLRMRYANESKPEIVDAFYRELVGQYVLGETLSYGMGKGAYEAAVRRHVEATDADKLAQYAKDRAAAVAEAQAKADARAEALKNPQTLDDYRNLLNAHIMTGKTRKEAFLMLTPEQRVQYDELEAESTREARERRKRELKTQVRAAGQTTGGEIIATKHTRDGYDLFVVQLADRVSKEDYKTLLSSAKRMGGWYSSFRGNGAVPGFQFKDRAQAEAFKALAGGDTAAAEEQVAARRDAFEDDRSQSAVERLTAMADKLDEQAQQAMNVERKTNTARRARFASAAEDAARQQQALAKTMRNIAQAIEGGRAKFLDSVRTKTQVEMLAGAVRTAKDNELRAKYDSYGEQQKRKGQPPTAETADYAEFPSFTAFRSDLASLARQMLEVEGTKKMGARLMKVADDVTDAYMEFAKANQLQVSQFGNKAGGLAVFASREDAERAIKRSGLVGKAIVLPVKRGENRVILSPSEAMSRGIWTGDGDKRITLTREFGQELVDAIGRRGNKTNGLSVPWQFESASYRLKAMARIGIETPAEFRSALREFIGLQEQAKEADRVKMLERDMVGRKNDGLDFFPTPQTVADQMVEAAGIEPDMAVLEPSAGMGHIADRIREAGAEPDVIEMANDRAELLEAKGFNVLARDFMEIKPRESYTFGDVFKTADGIEGIMRGAGGMGSNRVRLVNEAGDMLGYYDRDELTGVRLRGTESGYDRIIMNPPFSDRRDAEHVRHAFELLRPGGRLVAIMGEGVFFGKDKKAQDFRDWLEEKGGTAEKLPEGSFMDPTLPVNTAVNARMVVIDKPGAKAAKADDAPMFSRSAADPAESLADTLLELGQVQELFQLPKSDAKDLVQVAAAKNVKAAPVTKKQMLDNRAVAAQTLGMNMSDKPGAKFWLLRTAEGKLGMLTEIDGEVYIDVSVGGTGLGGSAIYDTAMNYTANNPGKVFIGDPNDLSKAAMSRRLENMLSAAVKYGGTDFMRPHQYQTEGRYGFAPLDWTEGDSRANIEAMVKASVAATGKTNPVATSNVEFDPATQSFRDWQDQPLDAASLSEMLGFDGREPGSGSAGRTTLQRNALYRALLTGPGARRALLESVRGQQTGGRPGIGGALERAFYSRGSVATASLSRESTQQIADAISARWANAPEIIVARDMSDYVIPQRVRDSNDAAKSAGASGEPEGFIYQGKVYLVSDQLRSSQDVARVLFHEALGHAGLRGVFGDELKPILRQIALVRAKDVRAKAKEYGLDMAKEADRLQAAEEVLANMAQTAPELGFVKRAIAAIRTWLRNNVALFRDIDVTDDEIIRDYILPARGFIERGRESSAPGALPVFSRKTPDMAMVDEATEALVQEYGEPVASIMDAERRHAAGERIFAMHEQDDTLSEITSVRQLKNWAPDQLVAVHRGVFEDGASFSRAKQTDTPEFRRWFGDSKVVDAQGKPLVVYHGTVDVFTEFRGSEIYLAEDRTTAEDFGDNVMRLYAAISNPLEFDYRDGAPMSSAEAIKAGFDGFKISDYDVGDEIMQNDGFVWVAFRPEQIKSAIGNRGTFDPANPDIRYSRAAVSNLANRATDLLNDALSHPGKLSFWDKSVGSMYHIAQRYPAFRRVFNSAQNFINDVSYYATEAAEQAPKILPRLETWRDLAKSPIKAADNNAIARPILEGTLSWTRDEDGSPVRVDDIEAAGIVWRDGELRSMFNLTDDQIALYREFRAATDLSLDNMGKADLLRYAGKDLEDLRDMVMDAPDVMAAAKVMRGQLQELADADPERSKELIAMAGDLEKRAERVQNLKRDGYAPLSRFGRYTVDVVVDGERRYFSLFDTARDANKMAAKMRAEFGADAVSQGTLSQREFEAFQGITPESLELFGNMLGLDSTGDEAQDKVFQTYLKLTKANRSALKRLIHRKGVAGYSDDMGRVLAAFVYSNARQTSAALHMGEMGRAVQDIPKGQGELKDVAIELSSYIKQPREEAQALRGLLFAQYLGGSVASAFVNFTQPFTVTFPYLIRFGGARRSAQALMKAMADQRDGVKLEDGLARALKTAEEQGVVAPQEVHQLMAQARGEATLKAGDGSRAGEALAMGRNAWTRTALAWGKLFGMAEQINRRSTFIAAYRIAAERGMRNPAAFATKAVNETQFVNNRANKARWARGPVGATLMTFKSYSVHYMELMHRLATREGPEGKKAAAMMLGMLFLVAGAGGLPFAEDLDDVIDMIAQRMGYNFSTKQAKQKFLEDLFGKAGAEFVDKGITGLAGSPIDISGRLSMANLIPGTGLLLKKPDQSRDMQELVGPVGDLVKRGWKGADLALSGEFGKALLEVSPRAVANAAKGVDMATTGVYTDTRGRKVIETDLADAAAKAIGFQPQSVALVQDATFTVQKMVSQNKMREAEIAEKWAQGIYEGNKAKIEEAREALRDWNRKNPKTPIRIELPQILKRVRAMRMSKEDRIAKTAPSEIRGAVQRELAAQ